MSWFVLDEIFVFETSISETAVSRGCRWRTCKIVWYLFHDYGYKNVSSWLQGCFFRGSRIYLSGFQNISFGVQEHIFWGSSKYRLGYKHISFGVQGSIFLNVVTRLGRRAEPSRQVFWLQSEDLLSLVASPFNRTTIHLLVVQLYYDFSHPFRYYFLVP